MIYERPAAYDTLSDAERRAVIGEYLSLRDDSRVVAAADLKPAGTARTVRVQDGETLVVDGPGVHNEDVLGGYYVVEADDVKVVIELAARCPAARMGGSVEVRPVVGPRL